MRVYVIITMCLGLGLSVGCKQKPVGPAPAQGGAKVAGDKAVKAPASADGIVMPEDEAPGPEPEAGSLPFEFGAVSDGALSQGQQVFFVRRAHWVESFGERGAFWRYASGEVVSSPGGDEVEVRAEGAEESERVPRSLVIGLGLSEPLEVGQLVLTRSPGERPSMTRALVVEGGAAARVRYLDLHINDGFEVVGQLEPKHARVIAPEGLDIGQRVYWTQGEVSQFGRVVAKDKGRAMVQGFGGEIVVKPLEALKQVKGASQVKVGQRVKAPFINQYLDATISEVEGELVTVRYAHSPSQDSSRLWRGELMP